MNFPIHIISFDYSVGKELHGDIFISTERVLENAAEFKVSGIPHIEFLDKDGKSIGQQIGGTQPEAFAKTLEGIAKKAGVPAEETPKIGS